MQGLGDADPPAHAAGELADPLVHDRLEPDQGEDPADLVVAGPAVGPLLEDGDVVDELEGGELAVEARLLGQVAEPAPHGEPAVAVDGSRPSTSTRAGVGRAARWPGCAAASSCRRRSGRAGR